MATPEAGTCPTATATAAPAVRACRDHPGIACYPSTPRVHAGSRRHAGSSDRRQYGCFQRSAERAAAAFPVRGRRQPGRRVPRLVRLQLAAWADVVPELSRLASGGPGISRPGCLQRRNLHLLGRDVGRELEGNRDNDQPSAAACRAAGNRPVVRAYGRPVGGGAGGAAQSRHLAARVRLRPGRCGA